MMMMMMYIDHWSWSWRYILIVPFILNSSRLGECSPSTLVDVNLPEEHLPYYLYSNPSLLLDQQKCSDNQTNTNDALCATYKKYLKPVKEGRCWGYEKKCRDKSKYYSYPKCPGDSRGWVKDKSEQMLTFWHQGDFGYVREKLSDVRTLCRPRAQGDSLLECGKNMVYCRVKNIRMDFTNLSSKDHVGHLNERYREDIFGSGQLGGYCQLDERLLKQQGEWKSPLQSWAGELLSFTELDYHPISNQTSQTSHCDMVLDKPTVFIKLDAGVNLFHHYCDFINLYASQHMNNSFDQDINIIMWDTSNMDYFDICPETWRVFSHHPVIHLREYDGKRVCVRDGMFPLLARMRFGLYYNMPLIDGCSGSGLFKAFNHHLTHRLNIKQYGPTRNREVRITLLVRSTTYRRILNQDELVGGMKTLSDVYLTVVDYKYRSIPFLEQVNLTHNSDIFIGMHGAGLSHVLFQPDWGVLFELYNCDDKDCYYDLARLRGVKYLTWQRQDKLTQQDEGHHPTLGAHKKFTNYAFDVTEFMRLITEGVKYVKNHPSFRYQHKLLYGSDEHESTTKHTEL